MIKDVDFFPRISEKKNQKHIILSFQNTTSNIEIILLHVIIFKCLEPSLLPQSYCPVLKYAWKQ